MASHANQHGGDGDAPGCHAGHPSAYTPLPQLESLYMLMNPQTGGLIADEGRVIRANEWMVNAGRAKVEGVDGAPGTP